MKRNQFYQAKGFDQAILSSDQRIVVELSREYLIFTPRMGQQAAALLFYAGHRVEPTAYAPMARTIAEHGYKTIIINLPYNAGTDSAFKAQSIAKAKTMIAGDTTIKRWLIGGHSLGGFLAACFACVHAELVDELVMIGTDWGPRFDFSSLPMKTTYVYGTNDGLLSTEKLRTIAKLLPPHANWIRIEGGNHSQFGWYGLQRGDLEPGISREKQQEILTQTLIEALRR